jgi:hypothetical protein
MNEVSGSNTGYKRFVTTLPLEHTADQQGRRPPGSAPSLAALGLNAGALRAVVTEGSQVLPNLSF